MQVANRSSRVGAFTPGTVDQPGIGPVPHGFVAPAPGYRRTSRSPPPRTTHGDRTTDTESENLMLALFGIVLIVVLILFLMGRL